MTLKWRGEWAGLVTLSVVAWLGWRATFNVDLSDESYYAIFQHDWWVGGIRASTLATLHQTAALAVYPLVWVYAWCVGGLTGLMLFLRILYVVGALAGAFTWLAFLRALRGPTCGWLAAATLLGFVPFGLPAPSYNTLGLQGLTVALGAFGTAALAERAGRRSAGWRAASAAGWAVAVVAYPTMAVALCGFCGLILLGRTPVSGRKAYVASVVAVVIAAVALVVAILTPAKLILSITYLSQINAVTSVSAKIAANVDLMRQVPRFVFAFVAMVLLGLLRPVLPLVVTCGVSGLALLALQTEPAVFFMHSHDALLLAALSGIGLLLGLRARAGADDRIVAIVMGASLVAGLATTATATYGAFNFCIGAAPAAVLALAAPRTARWTGSAFRTAAQAALLLVVMATSASRFYGDDPADVGGRERLSTGVFAGLNVQADQARLIEFAAASAGLAAPENTVAEFGRLPGLILATQAKVLALTPFPLQPTARPAGLAMTRAFYDEPRHRPRMVLTYSDQYTQAFNPIGPAFADWYSERDQFKVNGKEIKVYVLNPQ